MCYEIPISNSLQWRAQYLKCRNEACQSYSPTTNITSHARRAIAIMLQGDSWWNSNTANRTRLNYRTRYARRHPQWATANTTKGVWRAICTIWRRRDPISTTTTTTRSATRWCANSGRQQSHLHMQWTRSDTHGNVWQSQLQQRMV